MTEVENVHVPFFCTVVTGNVSRRKLLARFLGPLEALMMYNVQSNLCNQAVEGKLTNC